MTSNVRELEQRRDQALRDLASLDAQVAGGELTVAEAEPLRLRYERQAADAIAALDSLEAPTGEDDEQVREDPPAGREVKPLRLRLRRGRRPGGGEHFEVKSLMLSRRFLYAGALVLAALMAMLVPAFTSDRPPGGYATGNEVSATSPAAPPSTGRDLTTVTDAQLERAVAANPDVVGMRVALGDRYEARGRHDDAISQYLAALKLDPGSPEAQTGLAWVLFQTGRPEQGLSIVDRALERRPNLQRALWTKANILLYAGDDPAAALDVLRRMADQQLVPQVRRQVADLVAVAEARQRSGG